MYFTVNSAFQHFMSEFGLSDSPNPDGRFLSQEHIFDIFLNDTSKPSISTHIDKFSPKVNFNLNLKFCNNILFN